MAFQSVVEGPEESVQYMDTSNTITVYSGGSRSWRCNNPGLLGLGVFALQEEALGQACGVAAFGDYASGKQALVKRLASEDFRSLTVEQAYRRFQPSHVIPGPTPPRQ